jgi:DNA-binding beta-propeller fold protein YncE
MDDSESTDVGGDGWVESVMQASCEGRTICGMTTFRFLLLCAVAAAIAPSVAAQYKVLQTVKVGGEGGFDYVNADSAGRRLYVSRSGPAGLLHVYDLDTLKEVAKIAVGSSHGAAIDAGTHHGFATSKPVTMFDTETMKVIKAIDTGGNPDGYLDDPVAHRVYILSHTAPNVTVLDAKDGAILGTIDIGGAPEEAAVDGDGHLFVDIEDKDAIAVIDTASMKMLGKYDVSSKGGGCAGLAIDAKNGVLFAACRDKSNMIVLTAKDGTIVTELPTGKGSDGVVFNPATMEAFSSQGDGTLTVVKENSPTSFAVEQTVKTPVRAKTLTLDAKTGHILLITAEFGPAPAAVAGQRPARAPMVPDSFSIVVVGK